MFRVCDAGVEKFAAKAAEGVFGAFAGEVREDFGESLAFVEWAGAAVGSFGGIEMIFRVEKVGVGESAEEEARAKGRTKIVGFLPRGKIWKLDAIGVHASQQSG